LRTLPHHHPITVQLGGNKAAELLAAAKICESAGFRDININAGCPSLRVAGKGDFGARLMLFPELPAVLREVKSGLNSDSQLTIKHRIGVDEYVSVFRSGDGFRI
jgi:tRNA-dihydrouridine synthase A